MNNYENRSDPSVEISLTKDHQKDFKQTIIIKNCEKNDRALACVCGERRISPLKNGILYTLRTRSGFAYSQFLAILMKNADSKHY